MGVENGLTSRPGRACRFGPSRPDDTPLRSGESNGVAADQRDAAIIVRKGELSKSILNFELIKELAERLGRE